MGDFIRSRLRDTSSHHRAWQISAALALGVLCGLLPKFSLMFCLIACVCCAAPIHLPLAALACLVSSIASPALAATAGRVGLWSLTHPDLMESWLTLNALPWVPWLGLNNSIVHGSLLIGLALLLPVYALTKPLANRLAPKRPLLDATLADAAFEHELRPIVASADLSQRTTVPIEANVGCRELPSNQLPSIVIETTAKRPDADDELDIAELFADDHYVGEPGVDEQTCQELENLLATCNGENANSLNTDEVVQRAAQMAHFVDDLLTSCQLESTAPAPKSLRRDEPPNRPTPQLHVKQIATARRSGTGFQPVNSACDRPEKYGATDRLEAYPTLANAAPPMQRPAGEVHPAETLRYLLHHLKAIKDKV